MEHAKKFVAFVAGIGKVIGVIAALFSIVAALFAVLAGSARLYAYGSSRASATEVAVLRAERNGDHELLMFVAKSIAGLVEQNNHQALTGRIPYVQPQPTPAEVLGPQPLPKGNANR